MNKNKKAIIGIYNKSVILTYLGAAVSVFGMYISSQNISYAMVCLIICGICDLFDGKIARMCKRTDQEKNFGIQIDSLVDVISFLLFPIIILFNVCHFSWISYTVGVMYLLLGITRLGWFNITTDGNISYYSGLPVTYSALIIPIFYILFEKIFSYSYFWAVTFPTIYFLLSFLFIANIKLKKPTGVWYIIFSCLAIATIIILLI